MFYLLSWRRGFSWSLLTLFPFFWIFSHFPWWGFWVLDVVGRLGGLLGSFHARRTVHLITGLAALAATYWRRGADIRAFETVPFYYLFNSSLARLGLDSFVAIVDVNFR